MSRTGENALSHLRRVLIAALVLSALSLAPLRAQAEGILVFAAASLKTALDELAQTYEQQTGQDVTLSYAATSVLARQIQLGAPADLFISANVEWMDVLQDQGVIDAASRTPLLGNGLVLIGAPDQPDVELTPAGDELSAALGDGLLAMALVDAVPAGIYGKAALISLDQWEAVADRIAQTDNVRAALALVAAGAVPLGVVYRSDAQVEDRVRVVFQFPTQLHPPILYPVALTRRASSDARAFLDYLQSDPARAVFVRQGFSLPDR